MARCADNPYQPIASICTCAVHCSDSPYHEVACCHEPICRCACHGNLAWRSLQRFFLQFGYYGLDRRAPSRSSVDACQEDIHG